MTADILACLIALNVILSPIAPIFGASDQPAPRAHLEPVAPLTAPVLPNTPNAQIAAVLVTATQVSAGGGHTCALAATGVKCWGYNNRGQIGDGSTDWYRTTPADVTGLTSGATAIAAGDSHTCALTTTGVKCWGRNTEGQLGNDSTTNSAIPVDVTGLDASAGVTAIAAGYNHTCAITAAGVKCWGDNSYGQLGDNTQTRHLTPYAVSGLPTGVTAITGGYGHTCALTASGAQCWGWNAGGQLGDGTTSEHLTPQPVHDLDPTITALVAGGAFTCAITAAGGAKCWGANANGQLGDGTITANRTLPVDVSGLDEDVTAIAAGTKHACAVVTGGVKCWGSSEYGQLGDGTGTDRPAPAYVSGLTADVTAIAAGGTHSCAVTAAGGIRCWGNNAYGQLGDDTMTDHRTTALNVQGLAAGVSAIVAGWRHTCARAATGGVQCWGNNFYGQLGDGTKTLRYPPAGVSGLKPDVTAIAAGYGHTCAVAATGVQCWGYNDSGQLGNNTMNDHITPADVSDLGASAADIAAGRQHTCVLTTAGAVKCWGLNTYGQLGDGTRDTHTTPVSVINLDTPVTAIAAGRYSTCALTSTGGVQCWGQGPLGDGSTTVYSTTPVDVINLASVVTGIASGANHTCAVTATGVKCWGNNLYGQLGDDTTATRYEPVEVSGVAAGVTALAAGDWHTCAVNAAGVKCWGRNDYGQLGDGTTTSPRKTPVDVSGLAEPASAIAAGEVHTCALTAAGAKCWGWNGLGQLGVNTGWTPVDVVGFGVEMRATYLPIVLR